MRHSIATILFFALGITAAQASAVRVSFADLDLSKPADVAALKDRFHRAAETACGPLAYTADGQGSRLVETIFRHANCVRRATDRALAQAEIIRRRNLTLSNAMARK